MENNYKLKLYEIVEVVNDKRYSGFFNKRTGYIIKMRQLADTGENEYDLFMYPNGALQEFKEDELESTGKFLPPDEMKERIRRDAIKNSFELWEIITIVTDDNNQIINDIGFIYGMTKSHHSGEWSYGITLLKDEDKKFWLYENHLQKLDSKFLTQEEIAEFNQREEEKQAEADRVEPLTWEEKTKIEELLKKAKEDAGINGDNNYNVRIRFGNELCGHVHDKESKKRIAYRAYTISLDYCNEIDRELSNVLYTLSTMDAGEEFELGYKELDKISKALLFDGDLSRWT